ncbi:MAG: SPFH domain-containing protein [Saprospiraceae bacterium]|nr:SPFH domain-containing protein [Saprospiraceae bacterium]
MTLYLLGGLLVLLFFMGLFLISRYRRCPSDKILVIYGKTGRGSAKCLAGGAAFVWPVIQAYEYLDLSPISIDVDLKSALSRQNIRVNVPSRFTVAVSNEEGTMVNAAERLLGKTMEEIQSIAKDIIFGQLRLVVATMDIEEINSDRDKFLSNVASNVGSELSKIGLSLINVNITDIEDESGYIEALGKEAAAQAINDAKVRVAERNREGAIGEARAQREQRVEVAKAEADATVGEAEANAKSAEGENEAQMLIAASNASLREKEAEALRVATSAEKIQAAKALQDAYESEKIAEEMRAERDMASKQADVIVQAKIAKEKAEINADAEAEQFRRIAKGEADAILAKKEAEAKGILEILRRQAEGFDQIVEATNGNTKDAVLMLIADKLEELVKTQVDAIKNIKIDKVTVWEGGNQQGEGNATSKFVSGLYKSIPPLHDLFSMAGMDLPSYLGSKTEEAEVVKEENGVPTNGESAPVKEEKEN